MKHWKRIFGIPLLCLGAALMTGCFFLGCGPANVINITGTLMIAVGIAVCVRAQRSRSKY